MKKTSLHEKHIKLNANMANFAGWEMPIRYKNIKEEVYAVRNEVGIFDVSHMGEFFINGKDCILAIDYLITNDFSSLPTGKAIYSPLCNHDGKILDDIIVYKLSDSSAMICVNAANIEKDKAWIKNIIKEKKFDCQFEDLSSEFSLIALQGPKSEDKLSQVLDTKLTSLDYYEILKHHELLIARTGYTGEDGFEIFGHHEEIKKLWQTLISLEVTPCGLAARDVLRLEVAYPLYGQDLSEELTPLECNLKWTVKFHKENFIGKKNLENFIPKKRLIKLYTEKGIPRSGQIIYQNETPIGQVTSGTISTTKGHGICLGLVDKEKFNKEELHFLEIRGKKYPAYFTTKPFVTGGHK